MKIVDLGCYCGDGSPVGCGEGESCCLNIGYVCHPEVPEGDRCLGDP